MKTLIEYLTERAQETQAKMQFANAELQQAQARQQAAILEFNSYQSALNAETRREQQQILLQQQQQTTLDLIESNPAENPQQDSPAEQEKLDVAESESQPEVNKTELIRDVLRQNPNGLTPAGVWLKVKNDVTRPYLYAVLKRLKDREQVSERRGKYRLLAPASTKPLEGDDGPSSLVQ